MLRLSKSQTYTVPIVLRTLDIVELLHRSDFPLKAREIASITRISYSTTYRILRTLLERGYVIQNVAGEFNIGNSAKLTALPLAGTNSLIPLIEGLSGENDPSSEQIVELLLAVLQALRRGKTVQRSMRGAGPGDMRMNCVNG